MPCHLVFNGLDIKNFDKHIHCIFFKNIRNVSDDETARLSNEDVFRSSDDRKSPKEVFRGGRELTNLQDKNNTDNKLHTKKMQKQIYLTDENIYAQISTHSLF